MGKFMHRVFCTAVLALMACACASAPAWAEGKPFPRKGTLLLLGYDPEVPLPAGECEKRSSIAGIVRVALSQNKPTAQRIAIHLNVAGLLGVARAACPAAKAPAPLRPLTDGEAKLDAASCKVARDVARGPIAQTINANVEKEHVDIARGFVEGVAEAMAPIAKACDPGDYWAPLKVEAESLASRAASMRNLRTCLLWRRTGFNELARARDLAFSHGRAAGEARLERQAMAAIAGARHYCGKDDIAETFEKMQYDVVVALIAAAPLEPEKKN
jgi:hypothetical protein